MAEVTLVIDGISYAMQPVAAPTPEPTPEPAPEPVPEPTPAPTGTITHGRQITAQNTGHTAYFDAGLGRNVLDSDLIVHTGLVSVSDFVSAGGTITKRWFKGGLIINRHDVTLRACKVDGGVSGYYSGTHYRFNLDYVTIDTAGAADDDGIHFQDYTANRCRIGGCSDGAKINGNVTITESYLRCKGQDSGDHNDGLQAVGAYDDCTILRCNIDCRPTNGIGAANAAIMVADGSNGLMTLHDNLLAGGGYVLRCYENSTYDIQGNDIVNNSWGFGPVARAVIPASNLTWGTVRPNRIVAADGSEVSTISKP